MASISNVRLGPATLIWKGQDLGNSMGGITLSYERKMAPLKVDRYGDNEIDAVLTGTKLTIKFKAAEPVAATIANFMPEGSNLVGANGRQVGFAAGEGQSMRSLAGLLVLHPVGKSATDLSEDVNIYLAYPSGNVPLNYDVNNQRVYEVTMDALVDEEYTSGRRLGHIGPTNIS